MKNNAFQSIAVAAVLCVAGFAQEAGQTPAATPPARARMSRVRVVSPEVHPDRTVTLRIAAPKANSVTVSGEIMGLEPRAELTKGEDGVWSVTLGPLEPEIYSYGFSVDGVTVPDQGNSYAKPSSSYTSQVVIPGDGPQFYDARPVPHGDVRIVTYEAKTLDGMTRRMRVYTPPGYDASNNKYPVLYLFHGAGDWDVAWTDVGRANLIMDNLIADGKAKPMIVVMPSIFQQAALGTGALVPRARSAAPRARSSASPGARQDDGFTRGTAPGHHACNREEVSSYDWSGQHRHRGLVNGRRSIAKIRTRAPGHLPLCSRAEFSRGHQAFRNGLGGFIGPDGCLSRANG